MAERLGGVGNEVAGYDRWGRSRAVLKETRDTERYDSERNLANTFEKAEDGERNQTKQSRL